MTESHGQHLATRMPNLARTTAVPSTIEEILSEVTSAAQELIPDVDTAGILLLGRGGSYEVFGATSELPYQIDALQLKFNEGPCIEASLNDLIVCTSDFRTERRWPRYAAAVVELGVYSALSFKLFTDQRNAGALSLFSFTAHHWSHDAQHTGMVLAAHAAAALLANRESKQLKSAVASRDCIGQAKGIIMERFGVDDMKAFQMLRSLSQESNTRIADIAVKVIDTRGTGLGAAPGEATG